MLRNNGYLSWHIDFFTSGLRLTEFVKLLPLTNFINSCLDFRKTKHALGSPQSGISAWILRQNGQYLKQKITRVFLSYQLKHGGEWLHLPVVLLFFGFFFVLAYKHIYLTSYCTTAGEADKNWRIPRSFSLNDTNKW